MYMLGGGHDDDANAVYEFSFGTTYRLSSIASRRS